MAVPTITSISPTVGPTGGHNLVIITGTNFHLPPPPPDTGPSVPPLDGVAVTFNGEGALRVEIVSATLLYVLAPTYKGVIVEDPIPAIDVTVTNIDVNGDPIAGETVTSSLGYSYVRPILHDTSAAPTTKATPYTLVTEALVFMLRRQVLTNVVLTTHVDYAEPGVLAIALAKVPGLIVQGPVISKDLERWTNDPIEIDLNNGFFGIRQPPLTLKFAYSLIGVTDNERESLNMMGSIQECFVKGKYLSVNIDPLDPSQGRAELVLQMTQHPQSTNAPSDSNIRTWVANIEVRGVEVYFDELVEQIPTVEEINQQVQQIGSFTTETIVS